MADRLADYNHPHGAASKELDRTACLKGKVLLRGNSYERKSRLWDLDPALGHMGGDAAGVAGLWAGIERGGQQEAAYP